MATIDEPKEGARPPMRAVTAAIGVGGLTAATLGAAAAFALQGRALGGGAPVDVAAAFALAAAIGAVGAVWSWRLGAPGRRASAERKRRAFAQRRAILAEPEATAGLRLAQAAARSRGIAAQTGLSKEAGAAFREASEAAQELTRAGAALSDVESAVALLREAVRRRDLSRRRRQWGAPEAGGVPNAFELRRLQENAAALSRDAHAATVRAAFEAIRAAGAARAFEFCSETLERRAAHQAATAERGPQRRGASREIQAAALRRAAMAETRHRAAVEKGRLGEAFRALDLRRARIAEAARGCEAEMMRAIEAAAIRADDGATRRDRLRAAEALSQLTRLAPALREIRYEAEAPIRRPADAFSSSSRRAA